MRKLNWKEAKEREDERRQVADNLKKNKLMHGGPDWWWEQEFEYCKGYYCTEIIMGASRPQWCQKCVIKFNERHNSKNST